MLHLVLLWYGDILLMYALLGFALLAVRHWDGRILIILGGAENVPMVSHSGSQAVAAPTNDAQLFAQLRTLRISQLNGLDYATGRTILPLQATAILTDCHRVSRAVSADCQLSTIVMGEGEVGSTIVLTRKRSPFAATA